MQLTWLASIKNQINDNKADNSYQHAISEIQIRAQNLYLNHLSLLVPVTEHNREPQCDRDVGTT